MSKTRVDIEAHAGLDGLRGTGKSRSHNARLAPRHFEELDTIIAAGHARNRSGAIRWLIEQHNIAALKG